MTKLETTPGCIQSALEILGTKWTGLIIRDLADSPKRFCELERTIPDLNPRTLSKRLSDLEAQNIIDHDADSSRYRLTTKGNDLLPVLRKMADWGEKYPLDKSTIA